MEGKDVVSENVALDIESQNFCDSEYGICVQVLQKTGTESDAQAEVEINFYCPEEIAPSVSVSSESEVVSAGQSLIAYVSVENAMAAGCGTHAYNLKAELPDENWNVIFDDSSLDVGPYSTGTARVLIGAPIDASGNYELEFIATDADESTVLTGEAILNVAVIPAPPPPPPSPPPTPTPTPALSEIFLDVQINKAVVRRGGKIRVKVEVRDADRQILQADKISCKMIRSNGTWLYGAKRNTSNPRFSFKIRGNNPVGRYTVEVTASKGGYQDAVSKKFFKVKKIN